MTEQAVVALGDVIQQRNDFITIDDDTNYKRCRVRLHGKGIVIRDQVRGGDLKTKRQQVCRSNDFLVAEIDAKVGGFGVVPPELDGAIVSSHYFLFTINTNKMLPRYLDLYVRTPSLQEQVAARGSTNYAAIRPAHVLGYTIPLPSLVEQKRLVAILDDAETKITEARRLREAAAAESAALVTSAIGERLAEFSATGSVADVLIGKPRNGWSAPCDNAEDGVAVLSLGAVTGFIYRSTEFKRTSETTSPDGHYWLEPGDLLVTRSNTEVLLGHAAIYSGEPAPCIYPDLMMRLKVDSSAADTRFLYYWLRTPGVRARIQKAGSGTSSTMKKITQGDVMGLPFPVGLDLAEQKAVARSLDDLVSRIEDARSAQQQTDSDLAALIPALLDRAFHGELRTSGEVTPVVAAV